MLVYNFGVLLGGLWKLIKTVILCGSHQEPFIENGKILLCIICF